MTKKEKPAPLESGLITAMKALDNQIARRMERSPAEREVYGVKKWKPYQDKVEEVAVFVLQAFGDEEVDLDSLLVLSQALIKSLKLVVDELGEEGLGKMRSEYVEETLRVVLNDARQALSEFKGQEAMLN